MTNYELEERGKLLRAEIDQTYKKLFAARELNAMRGNDITAVIVKNIPAGTSFDDAENILRAAGFQVDQRPSANAPNTGRPDRYDVVGSIVPYKENFPSRTNIYVNLSPKAPGDYGRISKVSGGISLSLP